MKHTIIGALVDSVQEVFELEPDQIEPAPKIGTQLKTEFIKGMGKKDDRFIIILNIDKVFSSEELADGPGYGNGRYHKMAEEVNRQDRFDLATLMTSSEVVDKQVNRQIDAPSSDKEFSRLKEFIYQECGINITDAKRTMVEARLQKRLRRLGLTSFSRYCDYLFSAKWDGRGIDPYDQPVTTNKTDFFREPAHFDYLGEGASRAAARTAGEPSRSGAPDVRAGKSPIPWQWC